MAFLDFPRDPDDLFVQAPDAFDRSFLEEELSLLLGRLDADEAARIAIVERYLDRFTAFGGPRIEPADFLHRLPWAEPIMLLRSLVEQADALRWVPHQDRSKNLIHHFVKAVGKMLERCER